MSRNKRGQRYAVRTASSYSGYRSCPYRGIWQPCPCLCCGCCKDPLKCGCVIIGAIILLEIIPLIGCGVFCALYLKDLQLLIWQNNSLRKMAIAAFIIPAVLFLLEGILVLVGVLCRMMKVILAAAIVGIIVWSITMLIVVICGSLIPFYEVYKFDTFFWEYPGKPETVQMKANYAALPGGYHGPAEAEIVLHVFIILLVVFFILLLFWPYFITCLFVMYKRHRELGSSDMVKNDVL